ncbi:hypothetical protein [Halostagnicola bangensis]
MNVERREITSSSDPADDHPWYELSVDEELGHYGTSTNPMAA